jgi:tetratricopeptide (TPR) repeat protein
MEGRFEEAEQKALEALAAGRKVDISNAVMVFSLYTWALLSLQGRFAEIEHSFPSEVRERGSPFIRSVAAQCHLMLGREEQARKEFESLAANDFTYQTRNWLMPIILMCLGENATSLGDASRASRLYELLIACDDRLIVMGTNGPCFGAKAHWLGMLASTMKKWDDAVEHFEDAIETNTRIGARPYHARSQHEYARMLIERNESGDKEKAAKLLAEATTTFRELGMPTFLEDAETLLAKL